MGIHQSELTMNYRISSYLDINLNDKQFEIIITTQ